MYPVCDVEIDSGQIVSADGDKAAVTEGQTVRTFAISRVLYN